MHRRYTTAQFFAVVERLRAAFPTCSITTDVITGFPGETEEEFAQTMDFLKACAFASMHVFPYSERSGTPAASMPDSVPPQVRAQRAAAARALAAQMSQDFLRPFIGKTICVVLEHGTKRGAAAHGDWHFSVVLPPDTGRQGDVCRVRLTGIAKNGMTAEKL